MPPIRMHGDKKKAKSSVPQNLRPATEQVAPTPIQSEVSVSSSDEIVIVPPASLISEYDVLELKELCEGAQRLWGVTVLFDESNPMNSVGGIQVFAALKNVGTGVEIITKDLIDGNFKGGQVKMFDLSNGGVGFEKTELLQEDLVKYVEDKLNK